MTFVLRGSGLLAASLAISMTAMIGAGGGQALASTGCTSLNAGNVGAGGGVASGTGFDANDFITVTLIAPGAQARLVANGNSLATDPGPATVAALLAGQGQNPPLNTLLITLDVSGTNALPAVNITCTAAPTNSQTNSQNLRNIQIFGTQVAANISGVAISSAIDQGITDAFSNGGTLPNFGPNGGFIGFADDYSAASNNVAQTRSYPSEFSRFDTNPSATGSANNTTLSGNPRARFDDAFSAMAYAGMPVKALPRKPVVEREWNLWADVRGTGWKANDTSGLGNNSTGSQLNLTAGLGRKLDTNTVVGLVLGYENFKYDVAALGGSLKGDGETIGGYGARRFGNIQLDAALAWTNLNYSANAGAASGSFTASRWLAKLGLSGNYKYASFVVEPSARLYVLWENEKAWTDSLGTLQAARNFSAGRTALGAQVGKPLDGANGWIVTPYAGLYGDWRFSTDNAIPTGTVVANISNGWSGRATGGLAFGSPNGARVALGGEYGGIGANYKILTGNIRGSVPF